MSHPLVDLVVEEPAWLDALPEMEAIAEDAARLALSVVDLAPEDFSVALLACDDERIAGLNSDFRDKPTPTNVLSWPTAELGAAAPGEMPKTPKSGPFPGPTPLGDVAIALQTCEHEAKSAAKPLKNHVTHLILHGCLHLLGYDHETPRDAALMEGIERRALARIGIDDPYV